MRTIQAYKAMAKSIRDGLAAKNVTLGHSECLELVAHQFGFPDWNTFASKFDEAGQLSSPLGASADAATEPPVDARRIDDRYVLVPRSPSPSVDLVFLINLLRDKRLIATLCLAAKFGRVSTIEIEDLLHVTCLANAPDKSGISQVEAMISGFSESGWSVPEKLSGGMQLSLTPGFEKSMVETSLRVEIRPRRVIWGSPDKVAVSSDLEEQERRAALSRADSAKMEAASDVAKEMLRRPLQVSIYEIRRNFVVGEQFTGVYKKTVTLSDATQCDIELTPTVYDGRKVVKTQFPGNGDPNYYNYIGLNGSAQRGSLMVQLWDLRSQQKLIDENFP